MHLGATVAQPDLPRRMLTTAERRTAMTRNDGWRKRNVWLLIICIIISLVAAGAYFRTLQQQSLETIERTRTIYTERTENIVNAVFHKTDVLATAVKLKNGAITEADFQNVAKIVYQENSGIRGIQYMPGAIVTYSYPVKGNEAVIGKNFLEIPDRRKDVLLAIDTKSIALSGPYHLIQGGLGVVARNPIFLTDADGNEYFWGFSAIILDLPDAIAGVGLGNLIDEGYDYQLYCINENNERLVIEGNPDLDVSKAVCGDLYVPHHVWTLAVQERNPWINMAKAGIVFFVGLLLSLILWLQYSLMLQKEAVILAKDRFFSDISHDMRTPLNAIMGFSALARRQDVQEQERHDYLEKIESAGKLLLDLVNDTLTMSRANSGKLVLHTSPVSTEHLFDSIMAPLRLMAEQKQITLSLDRAAYRPRTVLADQLNVQKIFLNLLSNAVKYTPAGGHIWVTIQDDPAGSSDPDIVSIIRDDGIGMSPEFIKHIYEPFAQERQQGYDGMGTGLGLSIVKQLVDIMGGAICVESVLHGGTTFTVRLHLAEASVAESPVMDSKSLSDYSILAGRKVLVCEDNVMNQEIACEFLKMADMRADCARNGKEGLDCFSASAIGEYSAILMDIRMPVMDGFTASRHIRSLDRADAKTIPIIAVTADVLSDNVDECKQSGMNGYFSKPIEMTAMLDLLNKYIRD